jgi:hypothetical protein
MKNNLKKQTAIFIFLFIFILAGLLMKTTNSVVAQVPTAVPTIMSNTIITVQVPTTPVNVGDEFDIPVTLTTDVNTWGAQFQISYDQTLLEITGAQEGGFYKDWATANGADGMALPKPAADNTQGLFPTTAFFLVGAKPGEGPSGTGTLVVLKAKAIKDGTVELKLSEIEVNDAGINGGNTGKLGGVKTQNGIISIGGGVAAQPTAGDMPSQITGSQSSQNPAVQPTIERLVPVTSGTSTQGGIPWAIILPVFGALVIGGVAFFVTRKK